MCTHHTPRQPSHCLIRCLLLHPRSSSARRSKGTLHKPSADVEETRLAVKAIKEGKETSSPEKPSRREYSPNPILRQLPSRRSQSP
jgi:hypothetical protein